MVKVNEFRFGSIVVDNTKYSRDVLIFADGKVELRKGGIWMFGSHNIRPKEVELLLEREPEVVIVGTGTNNKARLSSGTESWTRQKRPELIVLPSHEAVAKLNELAAQGKRVAAIIHITC